MVFQSVPYRDAYQTIKSLTAGGKDLREYIPVIGKKLESINDEEEFTSIIRSIQSGIQANVVSEAIEKGMLLAALATGVGKTKIGIDFMLKFEPNRGDRFLVVVPTMVLRDKEWPDELEKWAAKEGLRVEFICYDSLHTKIGQHYTAVVWDEFHHITPNYAKFFELNRVDYHLALTATPPVPGSEKDSLIRDLGFENIYHLSLDQAAKLGIVQNYEISIVSVPLDDKVAYGRPGKKSTKLLTEKQMNTWINRRIAKAVEQRDSTIGLIRKRRKFLRNLKSKTDAAKRILSNLSSELRVLIFCGSVQQAEHLATGTLAKYATYHYKSGKEGLNKFLDDEVQRLTCIDAINEGVNVGKVDGSLIIHMDSQERTITQRIGRNVRFRYGHTSWIFILVSENTQDEVWCNVALENLDQTRITRYSIDDFKPILPTLKHNQT